VKFVETGGVRDVGEDDWRTVDKTARGNGT
jgi:hypothetical protein